MNKITSAINKMLKKWERKGFSPSLINTGNCDSFAWELEKKFPKGRAMWGDDYPKYFKTKVMQEGHCFFKYGKKFYDSESPNGTYYPDDLKYYQRVYKEDTEYWARDLQEHRKTA